MSSLKVLFICCLIYQTLAGGPSYPPKNVCVSCTDVLVNLAPLSSSNCDPAGNEAYEIFITYSPDAGLPDSSGTCVSYVPIEPNFLIQNYGLVI